MTHNNVIFTYLVKSVSKFFLQRSISFWTHEIFNVVLFRIDASKSSSSVTHFSWPKLFSGEPDEKCSMQQTDFLAVSIGIHFLQRHQRVFPTRFGFLVLFADNDFSFNLRFLDCFSSSSFVYSGSFENAKGCKSRSSIALTWQTKWHLICINQF